ncbi:C1q-like domain-containing protein [Ekhidna sp.]
MIPPKRIVGYFILTASLLCAHAQSSVGVNTTTPNSNSVLELVSPNSDQGFLIPRLTTFQRLSMNANLSVNENGLMVYDQDENFFYYWRTDEWIPGLGALEITAAGGDLSGFYPNPIIRTGAITNEKIRDEAISNQKLQDLSISTIKIQDGAITQSKLQDVGVLPGPYGNSYFTLQVEVDIKGRVVGIVEKEIIVNGNNIEDLSIQNVDIKDGTLTISKLDTEENANKILVVNSQGIPQWLPREQFQTSSLQRDHLFIGNDDNIAESLPVTGDISLTSNDNSIITQIANDAITSDKIANNQIRNEDLNKSSIPISGFAIAQNSIDLGNNKVKNIANPSSAKDAANKRYVDNAIATSESGDDDKDDTNELNTSLSLDGTVLKVTDAGGTLEQELDDTFATNVELTASDNADLDKDATNELITASQLNGTTLEITDAGGTQSIDLNPTFTTDTELANAIATSESGDDDKDDTNELNTSLSLDGTVLKVTDAGGTLEQELDDTFATNAELTASDNADLDKDATNELITASQLNGTTLEITDAGGTQSIDLNPTFTTDTELVNAIATSESSDDDKDDTNELNTSLSLDGTVLKVTDAGGTLEQELDDTFATNVELTASDNADLDKDATNELITASQLNGTTLEITDAGGTQSIDLNPTFTTDTELVNAIATSESSDDDKDDTNELNTSLSLDGTVLKFTDAGGTLEQELDDTFATNVELTASDNADLDKDATNELITASQLNGTTLEITDAGGTQSIDLNPTFTTDTELVNAIATSESSDDDKDDTNELNTSLSLDGTVLKVTDAGGTLEQELDDTFATNVELTASDNADLDKDATNELITASQLNGTTLEITDAGGTQFIDLNPTFTTDTELANAIATSESGDDDKDDTNELNTSLSLDGTVLKVTDAGGTLEQELDDTFATNVELTASDNADLDKDATNELITASQLNGTTLEITDAGGTQSIDLNPTFTTDTELANAIATSESGDDDKDDTNELNTSLSLDGTVLKVTDAGGTLEQELDDTFATDAELTASDNADLDKDATNELITASQLNGTMLEITDAGGTQSIDLNPTFTTDTELANAIATSESGDDDKDDTNELNTSLSLDGTVLKVTDAGGTLEQELDDTFATNAELTASDNADLDKDATNELITASQLNGTTLEITDAGGTQSIDLNPTFTTDTELANAIATSESGDDDKDDTNELNTSLSLDGTVLKVTDAGGTLEQELDDTFATNVELTASDNADLDKDATNELITASQLNGTTLEITDAGGTQSIDLNPTFTTDTELVNAIATSESSDDDKDDTNELNTSLSLDGTVLKVTDAGGTLEQELDDTFATNVELTASDNADLDKDATNELITASQLNGTTLEITDAGGTQSIDLNPTFTTDTELANAIATSESGDDDKDDTNELNTSLSLDGTVLKVTDAGGTLEQELDDTFATNVELTASDNADLDKDATNELITASQLNGTTLEITDAGGTQSIDLNPTFTTDTELANAIATSESGDDDKDDTNELNTSLSLDGTVLKVTDAGGTLEQELDDTFATDAELTASDNADLDKDATNELITASQLNGTMLEITDAGGTQSIDLNTTFTTDTELANAIATSESGDDDKDDTNELNTSLSLDGTVLKVTDAGGTLEQELDDTFATDAELLSTIQSLMDEINNLNEVVAFEVYLNGSTSSQSSGPIEFDREEFEEGGSFILSDHYFRVPSDGIYHFDAQITVSFTNNYTRGISLYVDEDETGSLDGDRVSRTLIDENSDQVISLRTSKTIKVEEGNRVYVRFEGPNTAILNGRANTFFSGHKVK